MELGRALTSPRMAAAHCGNYSASEVRTEYTNGEDNITIPLKFEREENQMFFTVSTFFVEQFFNGIRKIESGIVSRHLAGAGRR